MSGQVRILYASVLGVAVVSGALLHAADKIQLKGSTSVELPKPTRSLDEGKFKFDESNNMDAGGFLPPPSGGNIAPIDRKLKEMMDRKKNWIFENPYERKYDDRTAEILDTDKSKDPLLEHRLLQGDDKTAMQKFIEEKDPKGRSPETSSNPGDTREMRGEMTDNNTSAQAGSPGEARNDEKPIALIFGSENSMFKERTYDFDTATFEKRMERTPVEGGLFGDRFRDNSNTDREESFRQQESSRESDFNRLLQGRSAISTASPTADSRLESALNPSLTARSEPSGTRRVEMLGSGPRGGLGDASRSSGLIGMPRNLPNSSGPDLSDISSRVNRAPSFLPNSSPISTAPSAPAYAPRPFVHELPRRKF